MAQVTRPRLSYRETDQLRRDAQRSLAKALAGMYDERGDLAMALLETGKALVSIAELDTEERALERVLAYLEAARR